MDSHADDPDKVSRDDGATGSSDPGSSDPRKELKCKKQKIDFDEDLSGSVMAAQAQVAAAEICATVAETVVKLSTTAGVALPPSVGDVETSDCCPVAALKNRPERTGTWFIVHESVLGSIEFEEMVDIYSEFFERHPNGSVETKGFAAVKLNGLMINRQRGRIRMSSYRWLNVNGHPPPDEFAIPSNYTWFLEKIKHSRQIGWMDFIAGIGVNCPVHLVLDYMGGLYARLSTMGAWMYDLSALDIAMHRGWIYQETAFGSLDGDGCRSIFHEVRASFLAMRDGGNKSGAALQELFRTTSILGKLIHRRGFEVWKERDPLFSKFTFDFFGGGNWVQGLWNQVAPTIGLTSGTPLSIGDGSGSSDMCEFADFGTQEAFSGAVVWATPACAEVDFSNADDLKGRIVVVRRGMVSFVAKAERAAKAGATALIVVNTENTTMILGGGSDDFSVPFPVACVSSSVGEMLLPGTPVAVTPRTDESLLPLFRKEALRVVRSITPLVCLTVFTMDDDEYRKHSDVLCSILAKPSYELASNAKEFGEVFGGSIVHAYLETALTYEADREAAIGSVASYIYNEKFNHEVTPSSMLKEAWSGLYALDSPNVAKGMAILAEFPEVQSRGLGLGIGLWGTKVVDNHRYKAAHSGEVISMDFSKSSSANVLYNLGKICGEYTGDSSYAVPAGKGAPEERLELFICEPPAFFQDIARGSVKWENRRVKEDGFETAAVVFITRRANASASGAAGSIWGVQNRIQSTDLKERGPLQMPLHEVEFN